MRRDLKADALVGQAFDAIADRYDALFTRHPVGAALRQIAWDAYPDFSPGQRVLDLGCGTGADARHLARMGVSVVGLDASKGMVDVARRLADEAGLTDRIEFLHKPMEDVGAVSEGRFDGAVSGFGAINCVADPGRLGAVLADRLRPGAPLVLVAMGRFSLWEIGWHLVHGRPRKAFRRFGGSAGATVGGTGFQVHYWTPGALAAALEPGFRLVKQRSVGVVLPPTSMSDWLVDRPDLLRRLVALERRCRHPSLANVADHYISVFKRRSTA